MLVAALAVLLLAGLSLFLPWDPVYDPWGWLIWGRELTELELDTSGGPSWKPLPVLFTAAFSALPGAAPDLWLVTARAGWLAAIVVAAFLAARLCCREAAGRRRRLVAAAIAAGSLVLLHDGFTPWLRQFAGGLSEPLLTALVLAAVERGLAGRSRAALALAAAAALVRPEVWPFLALYAIWLWRGEPRRRPEVAIALAAVAALWFLPDLIGSGNALTGADRAREGGGTPPIEALEVLGRAAILPLAALWVGAAVAVLDARRRGDRAVVVIALGALAWIAVVAVMAAGGYAGLPRFIAPAAAIVCVLGGVGLARLGADARRAAAARRRPVLLGAAAVLAAALALQAALRTVDLRDAAARATAITASQEELLELVEIAGPARLRGCPPVVLAGIAEHTALAWKLETPPDAIAISSSPPRHGVFFERADEGWRSRCYEAGPEKLGLPNASHRSTGAP